ncbi:MAG: site-specific integrase [Pseudomonadota bacterium]
MASIIPVGDKFRAQVRRAGHPVQTKTHDTLKEAEVWARAIETAIDSGKKVGIHGKTGVTLAQAIDRYLEENPNKSKTAVDIIGYLKKGMGKIDISKMTDSDIVTYIQKKNFGPMSGSMHFSFLGSVLKMAKVGWKYHVPEILEEARDRLAILGLIGSSQERERRPTATEIEKLLAFDFPTPIPMKDIIRFAMSSAMRQAEITRIKHATFNEQEATVVITDRKHPKKKKGNHKTVPLIPESVEIIKRQTKVDGDDNIFPFRAQTIGMYFTNACKALGIVDLRFHDLRHEGTSRLFEMGYQIHEVAMFTGHEDWKMLRRYTQLEAKNLRKIEAPKQEMKEEVKPEMEGMVMDAATLEQFKMFQAMQAMMKAQAKAA